MFLFNQLIHFYVILNLILFIAVSAVFNEVSK